MPDVRVDAGQYADLPNGIRLHYARAGRPGGKLLLFQAASPSVGVGRIKNRDLPTLYGTDRHGAALSGCKL